MVKSYDVVVKKDGLDAKVMTIKKGALAVAARAVYQGMQGAFAQSQREVPVRTGVLKNSGQLKEPELIDAIRARVAITYGGAASKYASEQHDNMTLNHPGGGKAHFVIDPVRAQVPAIKALLKKGLQDLAKKE